MGAICGCIMLLATIVFLVGGFVPLFDQIGGWDGIDKFALKDARIRRGGRFRHQLDRSSWGGRHPVRHRVDDRQRGVEDPGRLDRRKRARRDAWVKHAQQDDPWSRGPEDPASSQTPTPSSAPREANDPAGRTWKH